MSSIELCWNVTSYLSILVQLAAAGVCLGIFVSPYLPDRRKAVRVGVVYGVVMIALYVMPPQIDNILAYFIGTLAAFLMMCAEDRLLLRPHPSGSATCNANLAELWSICGDPFRGYCALDVESAFGDLGDQQSLSR